jgi:hypothetical protein
MMEYKLEDTGPNWTTRLASFLEAAKAGDIIVVPNYYVLDLAVSAG